MKNTVYRDNKSILKSARNILVGGVNSPVRAFGYVGEDFVPIKRGRSARLYDYDGKSYIDYVLSFGASILGHAHPFVLGAVRKAIKEGLSFGATCAKEIELACLIKEAIPFIDKIRFVNSGTEAVMGAVRLARGYTGRDKIIKFTNAYHGHADYLLARAGSGLASSSISISKGVPDNFLKDTFTIDYSDENLLKAVFRKNAGRIAAIIVEPVGGNNGVVPPDIKFLKKLREITRKYGSLLIFDEVITGFRFSYGSSSGIFGIEPDITCLGKITGGGLPIGAFAGGKEIMNKLAPCGEVYQASTFAGNPVVMSSGIATLKRLKSFKKEYGRLSSNVACICNSIKDYSNQRGIYLEVSSYKTMFSIRFSRKEQFSLFYRRLLEQGVYFAPSEYEANFISFAHTANDIEKTIIALKRIFNNWANSKGRNE